MNTPAMVAGTAGAIWVSSDGEVETLRAGEALQKMRHGAMPLICHAPATWRRLNGGPYNAFDLLELFAFVRPAQFCVPTPRGVAQALNLALPETLEQQALILFEAANTLLAELKKNGPKDRQAEGVAWAMDRGNWPWALPVLTALGVASEAPHSRNLGQALRPWTKMTEWSEYAPEPPAGHEPVSPEEAGERLAQLLGEGSEERPEQKTYAAEAAQAFIPRDNEDEPRLHLADAGTGVGKTLGYIAPASVWAEKNHGPVWISTFTRNLQRQLDGELDRLYPDPHEKRRKVVVRKGRENYLCLLNMEEAVARLGGQPADARALGLMARWAMATRDGDMVGGDFPGWLGELLGYRLTVDMTDTRGECIYSACTHYQKCFVERNIRRARRARIVVANHALVMIQAALGGVDDGTLPTRYVFDEGHHVFGAADSAFSADLTGFETSELRRWLLGAEDRQRSRARGLRARIEDLVTEGEAETAVIEIIRAAQTLPGPGWGQRMSGGTPKGAGETFLALIRQQVYAREKDTRSPYNLEADSRPPVPGLVEAALEFEKALEALTRPLKQLMKSLTARLDDEADELETSVRIRIESICRSLERRALLPLQAWRAMLKGLPEDAPEEFVDWLGVERREGRDIDVGMHRHWVDPTVPFFKTVIAPTHGAVITSATLCDNTGDDEKDWHAATMRTGAIHMPTGPSLSKVSSPFDYAANTKVLVIGDIGRNDMDATSAAFRELFLAAGGGALGLFTAISRLRAIHQRIAQPLERSNLTLLSQHVDAMDTGTLIDIFKSEENSCLLGTDAVRDGVDVPGRSLRLMVYDKVPWSRPTLLHKARKAAFQGGGYDDMLTRLKLKQAFGRLVRRADDRGVFVMLDKALPSRLATAFPEGVEVERVGLAEAIDMTGNFLNP